MEIYNKYNKKRTNLLGNYSINDNIINIHDIKVNRHTKLEQYTCESTISYYLTSMQSADFKIPT